MSENKTWKSLIRDLMDRKVFRSVLAYGVGGWAVIQASDVLLPIYNAPPWALQALVTLVLVGFPLFVVLAWSYDFTRSGLKRTDRDTATARALRKPGARAALASAVVLVTAGTVWWVWAGYYAGLPDRIARSARSAIPVVAVAEFENLTGNEEHDWLGVAFANLARDNLTESDHLVVASPGRLDRLRSQAGDDEDLGQAAARAGIEYIVSGEFIATGGGLTLTVRVSDLNADINLIAQTFNDLSPEKMIALADRVATLTKQGLGVPHTEDVARFASDFVVGNMAAYEAFVGGLQSFVDFDYQAAEQAFETALRLAPDFHMARFHLAQVNASSGRIPQALDTLLEIPGDALLTPKERLLIDAATAKFAHESERAVEIYSTLYEQYPYDVEAGQLLAEAYWNNFDEDAAIDQLERLIEIEPENPAGYMALGERQLELGDLANARPTLEKYVSLAPGDRYGHTLLGDLDLLSAEPASAQKHYAIALEVAPGFTLAEFGMARSYYLRGEPERAEVIWGHIVDDPDTEPSYRIDAAFDLTGLLRGQRRFEEALVPLSGLEPEIKAEQIREAMALSTLGQVHIDLGDYQKARSLIDLAIERAPIVPTRYLFARGQLEARQEQVDALEKTAAEIRSLALPPDDPDRTEDKAAAYLEGQAALFDGEIDTAIERLETAVSIEGYRYAIYELGLAEAFLASGDAPKALAIAQIASTRRDAGDLRLDLEFDRVRAADLAASIQSGN